MKKPYGILRLTRWVFLVLAYGFGIVLQGIVAGLVVLVIGGDPIEILPGAPLPARAIGALNLFISAPISFLVFHGIASAIHLLLDIRERLEKAS